MEKLANTFIEEVMSKSHVNHFIKHASFSLCIQTEKEMINFQFSNGSISRSYPQSVENFDVIIVGSSENIRSILSGQEKLRDVIHKRGVRVTTTFRKLLFLESLFILSRKYE